MERYAERVAETLTGAGYRWYETANYCRTDRGRDLRAQHNLAIWRGADYLGVGVGAVSTLGGVRRRNLPSVGRYVAALGRGDEPPHELEQLDSATRDVERLMLGLRLDEPFAVEATREVVDRGGARAPRCRRARRAPRGWRAPDRAGPPARRGRHGRAPRVTPGSPLSREASSPRARRRRPYDGTEMELSRTQARDPPPRGRGVRRDRPAGRLQGARRALGPRRLALDRPPRALRARVDRAPDAPPHLRGARPHREWLSPLHGGARRDDRGTAGAVRARPHRDAQRARGGAPTHDGDALRRHPPARARLGARARGRGGTARRGAGAPVAGRDRRGDHRLGQRLETGLRVRARCRPGPRRVGARVPRGDDRREARQRERDPPGVRGSRPLRRASGSSSRSSDRPSRTSSPRRPISTSAARPASSATRAAPSSRPASSCSRCSSVARPCSGCSRRRSIPTGPSCGSGRSSRARSSAAPRTSGTTYGLANRSLGVVGLLGPLRMDYEKAIRSVRAAAFELSRLVEDVYGAA